jgi:hypothetical protein
VAEDGLAGYHEDIEVVILGGVHNIESHGISGAPGAGISTSQLYPEIRRVEDHLKPAPFEFGDKCLDGGVLKPE